MSNINPALEPLKFLIGKWESIEAKGQYPNIEAFSYNETIEFESCGQPLLNFTSRSSNPVNGKPMHLESGFLRINPGTNQVAFMVSHNFGVVSLEEGTVTDQEVKLESKFVGRMSFAKDPAVTGIRRTVTLQSDGSLKILVDMETSTTPFTNHLTVTYKKIK